MNLSNLKPAEGSRELDVVRDLVWEELLPEVIKVLSKDLDTLRRLVSKAVRCLCSAVCPSSVLRTSTV